MSGAGGANMPPTVDVLVVGGGFAGLTAAAHLGEHRASVVVVDPKPYFEYTPSALRCMIKPAALAGSTAEHRSPYRSVSFVHGTVVDLQTSTAVIAQHAAARHPSAQDDGAQSSSSALPPQAATAMPAADTLIVQFKVCIWAGGTHYSPPIRPDPLTSYASVLARKRELEESRDLIRNAKNILVIGGGIVGVELAAELVTATSRTRGSNQDKKNNRTNVPVITVASSSSRLLPRLPNRASMLAERFLTDRGVRRVHGRVRRVGEEGGNSSNVYETEEPPRVRILADTVFDCTGAMRSPTDGPIRRLVEVNARRSDKASPFMGRSGMVRVRDTLQIYGVDNIFVAGDAAVVEDELALCHDGGKNGEKTAYAAQGAGAVAAENALRLLRSGRGPSTTSTLLAYPNDAFPGDFPRVFAVSLGKWNGILCIGPVVIGGVLASITKFMLERLTVRGFSRGGFASRTMGFLEGFAFAMASALERMIAKRRNRETAHPIVS